MAEAAETVAESAVAFDDPVAHPDEALAKGPRIRALVIRVLTGLVEPISTAEIVRLISGHSTDFDYWAIANEIGKMMNAGLIANHSKAHRRAYLLTKKGALTKT